MTVSPVLIMPALERLNDLGIAVFAASGGLLAAERRQTFVTFLFFAVATAVGGGTVRDLLIGAPVFWIRENSTLLICFVGALAVWVTPGRIWGRIWGGRIIFCCRSACLHSPRRCAACRRAWGC